MKTICLILGCLLLYVEVIAGVEMATCDDVYIAEDSGKISGTDTPNTIDINRCMKATHDTQIECSFDVSKCTKDCSTLGYKTDEFGCVFSCDCNSNGYIEEDIKYDEKDVAQIKNAYDKIPKGVSEAASIGIKLWNENVVNGRTKVPYVIDSSMSTKARTAISHGIASYTENTCIDFVARTNEVNYIIFVSKGGCWSYIGRRGGKQEISIGIGCAWKGIVQHELMHALGFWHEQSRPDRDDHIRIIEENIIAGKQHNFNKRNSINSLGSNYDIQSIMHYGGFAFSKNRQATIVERKTNEPVKSQRQGFTEEDKKQLNLLYSCSSVVPVTTARPTTTTQVAVSWSNWGAWSTCSVTCGAGVARRSRQCLDVSDAVSTGCVGQAISTKSCEQSKCTSTSSWGQWGSWGSCARSCGRGFQWRYRGCVDGVRGSGGCLGSSWRGRVCNTNTCPTKPRLTLFTINSVSTSTRSFCRWGNIYTGDFNNDGRSDLLCYYRSEWVQISYGSTNVGYTTVGWEGPTKLCRFSPSLTVPGKVFVGDFNGDGKDDLMCRDDISGKMRILFVGIRGFSNDDVDWEGEIPNMCGSADNLSVGDVDGDGDADLVCRKTSGLISVLRNQFK
ncbi:uncharacterized protein LOC100176732 isoform X1 [Ciona intestinalis]